MRTGSTRVHGTESADVTDRLERELQRRHEECAPGMPLRAWTRGLLVRALGRGGVR
ncbi:hypothetical protein ACIP79_41885 [Streptomyces sp. NPDC088747]|uniref:hypothetical protein n=1 Tax=Streptomyces sp. NPDC088747 TaxID=3365886 RepID=UPI0037F9C883